MIDLDGLAEEGLLVEDDYKDILWGEDPERVDYGKLYTERFPILRKACRSIRGDGSVRETSTVI